MASLLKTWRLAVRLLKRGQKLALVFLLIGLVILIRGECYLAHYQRPPVHQARSFVSGMIVAQNRTNEVEKVSITMPLIDPLVMKISFDVLYKTNGTLYFRLAVPFHVVSARSENSNEPWEISDGGALGALVYAAVPVTCGDANCAWAVDVGLVSNETIVKGSHGVYSIVMPFDLLPVSSAAVRPPVPAQFLAPGISPRDDMFEIEIRIPQPLSNLQFPLSSPSVTPVPSMDVGNAEVTWLNWQMKGLKSVAVQYVVVSEYESYQGDMIWGPTLLVTGIGLVVGYVYEFFRTRLEEEHV